MADLYHFYVLRNPGVTRENLEAILDSAPSWFRYHDTCYIVETKVAPKLWRESLQAIFEPHGFLFICKFDESHYWGFMTKAFWEWYQSRAGGPA